MSDPVAPEPAKATRREWIGLAVIALPCVIYSMDLTVLNLAVPHLTAELKPTASELLWIVDIYGFFLAGSLITMGTIGDRVGRRKLLLIGAAAFGAMSVLAAFSPTAHTLIIARALLGVSAATLAPSTLSLIRNMFLDPSERTFAIGVWVASFSAGAAIGPVLGGLMLTQFWWGSVFLLNVPVMLLLLAVGPVLIPEYRDPNPGRMDIASAALSLVAVLSIIWGVKRLAEFGLGILPFVSIAAGVALGIVFLRRQTRLADPLVDVALLKEPVFSAALSINVFSLFMAFGSFLFIAQYLQLVLGLGPLEAGLWTAPSGVAFVTSSMLTPGLTRTFGVRKVIVASLLVSAAGFALISFTREPGSLAVLMTGMLIFCLGLAPVGTLTTDLVIGLAPPERAGAASAISETSFELGGALGIAVLGSVATAVYRSRMADAIAAGLPDHADARDTLAGALAVAGHLPAPDAAALVAAARDAYTHAFSTASLLSAALSLLTAVIALAVLRDSTDRPEKGASCRVENPVPEHST